MIVTFKDGSTLEIDKIVAKAVNIFFAKKGSEFYLLSKHAIQDIDKESEKSLES